MYALIDSNNFFVACEHLFRPEFKGVATVVLSSNDGCAVSRSAEAKALGVAMGEPLHKLRERFEVIEAGSEASGVGSEVKPLHDNRTAAGHTVSTLQPHSSSPTSQRPRLAVFSANFELYGDISERIATLLCSITPQIELYSVDEAFLEIDALDIADYESWGRQVRATILKNVGIPVSIGIAPTKTLCKLANHWAKQHDDTGGVVVCEARSGTKEAEGADEPALSLDSCALTLASTPVTDVWGVGWRLAPKLKAYGIYTALDLARMRPKHAQQLMGIQGKRMVMELNGMRCLALNTTTAPQCMIARGRQFGRDARDLATLSAAITAMATRACTELRREHQRVHAASVYLMTNRRKAGYHSAFLTVHFAAPTSDTGEICRALVDRFAQADEHHGYLYHKAEVILHKLTHRRETQTDLFDVVDLAQLERSDQRMAVLDQIRAKHGPKALMFAAERTSDAWKPRRGMSSPRYTSSWADLPTARTMPLEVWKDSLGEE